MVFLGIDVAKDKLDCCLVLDGLSGKLKHKTVSNSSKGFTSLINWLSKNTELSNVLVVIEATANYHEPVCQYLFKAEAKIFILHANRVRLFAKGMGMLVKTDKVDSYILASYVAVNQTSSKLKQWQPASTSVQTLKQLLNRRDMLCKDKLREESRLEQLLLVEHADLVIKDLKRSIKRLTKDIEKIEQHITKTINTDTTLKHDKALLESIPAIAERSSLVLLNILHSHQFNSAGQLASYIGVVPVHHESGKSVFKQSRISKTSASKVRSQLYMATVVAIQHNPRVKAHYEKLLKKGKTKMQALIAGMRKLIHMCFGVFKNKTPYDANYLENIA